MYVNINLVTYSALKVAYSFKAYLMDIVKY